MQKNLHRDISMGNITISDRVCFLVDWDLAKDIKDLEKISRQPSYAPLTSLVVSHGPDALAGDMAAHTQADDWESFSVSFVELSCALPGIMMDSRPRTVDARVEKY
jgi:hypothetical protein